MRREGKDSLQSEVIHSHPGVVNVQEDPVKVHICTSDLKGREWVLLDELCFLSDTERGKNCLCRNTCQKVFEVTSSLTSTAEAPQRGEVIASSSKQVPLLSIWDYKDPLKIPC